MSWIGLVAILLEVFKGAFSELISMSTSLTFLIFIKETDIWRTARLSQHLLIEKTLFLLLSAALKLTVPAIIFPLLVFMDITKSTCIQL